MNKEISLAFRKCKDEKRPALLTYIVAGDYNKRSLQILNSISEHARILSNTVCLLTQQQQMVHNTK